MRESWRHPRKGGQDAELTHIEVVHQGAIGKSPCGPKEGQL